MTMHVELGINGKKPTRAVVASVEDASAKVRSFIDANDLGAGCGSYLDAFTGGDVYAGGIKIARISYNGRIWPTSEAA